MNSKPVFYGEIGFISGVILTILIGFLGMSGMMWGMGEMRDGWFRGRCENYYPPELPEN